jgi:hypothetical protein
MRRLSEGRPQLLERTGAAFFRVGWGWSPGNSHPISIMTTFSQYDNSAASETGRKERERPGARQPRAGAVPVTAPFKFSGSVTWIVHFGTDGRASAY